MLSPLAIVRRRAGEAGVGLLVLVLIVWIVVTALFPKLTGVGYDSGPNTKGVVSAISHHIKQFRNAHGGRFPADLRELIEWEEWLRDASVYLRDPLDAGPRPIEGTDLVTSFVYAGRLPADVPDAVIVGYPRLDIHPEWNYVMTADGGYPHVTGEQLRAREGDPSTCLRASYDAVVATYGDALTPERDAELRAFYEIEE